MMRGKVGLSRHEGPGGLGIDLEGSGSGGGWGSKVGVRRWRRVRREVEELLLL